MKIYELIDISQNIVPNGQINNIPALVQIMAWHQSGDKPLSEPMMESLLSLNVLRHGWLITSHSFYKGIKSLSISQIPSWFS